VKTPREAITALRSAVVTALKSPRWRSAWTTWPTGNRQRAEEFAAYIRSEIEKLAKILKQVGAKPRVRHSFIKERRHERFRAGSIPEGMEILRKMGREETMMNQKRLYPDLYDLSVAPVSARWSRPHLQHPRRD